jgi:hypothetical protein
MAGNPVETQVYAAIEAMGGWSVVWDRVAAGESQTSIAASLDISQGFLSRLVHKDPERIRAFREAKRRWAITLVEHTGELVKNVKENRDAIAKVREQASHARWEAGKWDRETFGEDKGAVNVNVLNVSQMHLDALRWRITEAARPVADLHRTVTAQPQSLPPPIDVTPEPELLELPPGPSPQPSGVEWRAQTESAWCYACSASDCPHARREYLCRVQAHANTQPTGPKILRGLV